MERNRKELSHSSQKIVWIDEMLERIYNSPNHGNYKNPTNELFYILFSKKTPPERYQPIFKKFKRAYPSWNQLLATKTIKIVEIIRPLGISRLRAKQIKQIAAILYDDFGRVTLAPLKKMSTKDAKSYLLKLPGIGEKSARCVLMYSLGRDIAPMDTHAIRIMHRVGILPDKMPASAHHLVDNLLPDGMAHRLHVNLVAHGRKTCTSKKPQCTKCALKKRCCYFVSVK